MMKPLCWCATFLAFAACAPQGTEATRDTSVPLGASSRFAPDGFAGDWVVWARFRPSKTDTLTFAPTGNGMQVSGQVVPAVSGAYRLRAPGVLEPQASDLETLVVMWVDEDFETAAIGTASGRFGAVLDRDGSVPDDRAAAVLDILAFYGWNTEKLQRTGE